MYSIKLHKWLFSLTLIISLAAFSGVVSEQVKPVNTITEIILSNNTSISDYYASFTKQNLTCVSITYYSFYFKAFIQTQNGIFSQKEKVQNSVVLIFKNGIYTPYLEIVSANDTGDYPFTFIG